jgi:hypothetical protein
MPLHCTAGTRTGSRQSPDGCGVSNNPRRHSNRRVRDTDARAWAPSAAERGSCSHMRKALAQYRHPPARRSGRGPVNRRVEASTERPHRQVGDAPQHRNGPGAEVVTRANRLLLLTLTGPSQAPAGRATKEVRRVSPQAASAASPHPRVVRWCDQAVGGSCRHIACVCKPHQRVTNGARCRKKPTSVPARPEQKRPTEFTARFTNI